MVAAAILCAVTVALVRYCRRVSLARQDTVGPETMGRLRLLEPETPPLSIGSHQPSTGTRLRPAESSHKVIAFSREFGSRQR